MSASVRTLATAVERLASLTSAEEVADVIRVAARKLSGADGIAIVLREGERVRYVDEDAVGPLWKGRDFPIDACISGWAMTHAQRVIIPDVFKDERVPHDLYRPTFVRSCVMTPVGSPEPIACIGAYWAEVREPTAAELESLEAIAKAAAAALENARLQRSLRQAWRLAEASSRAKSDFLTNMSHEIRTPLNGVVGALALLSATALSPEQARLVDMLRASGDDLESVLKDILDFARLQSEVVALESGAFHLGEAVREVGRLYELRFARKGLDFRVEVEAGAETWVLGDRGAVKQVLANLAHNALQFTERGKAVLSVATDGPDRFRFVVADTGIGIAEDAQARIFDVFEQADTSNTRSVGGLGLGLAVSRRLVELMGGSLSLESREGAGSIFTLIAPLPTARPPADRLSLAVPRPATQTAETPARRILVVDDHPTNRAVVIALLDSIGVVAVEAGDGREACEAFASGEFDAVLMDIQMPIMDGLTATRAIRDMERRGELTPTPIIMLTANALPEHVEASRLAGADRHLAKPISPALLFEALQAAMDLAA